MRIHYAPDPTGDDQEAPLLTVDFVASQVDCDTAELVETLGADLWSTWREFGQAWVAGRHRARRAALWVRLRAEHPDQAPERFAQFTPRPDQIAVALGDTEVEALRRRLIGGEITDPEQRAAIVELLGEDPAPAPKALPSV